MKESQWDLSALFENKDKVEEFLKSLKKEVQDFEKTYQGHLKTLSANDFNESLKQYENLLEKISAVMTYAYLLFASNTQETKFYSKCEMACTDIQQHILFYEIEFVNLDSKKQETHMKKSKQYAFFLQKLIDKKRHTLNLDEEKIALALSPVGVDAFSRLFDQHLSSLKIPFEGKVLNEEEILAFMYSPDRKKRKKSQKAFSAELAKSRPLLTYIFNMVRKNLHIETKLRNYEKKESFRHLNNQISQESVDSMLEIVNANFSLVHRYYHKKAQLLGHKLKDYDRYAPLSTESVQVPYSEALQETLNTFKDFSPDFYKIASKAIASGWVDSHPRAFKQGGAFSHSAVPSAHPYVLLNYTGNRRDMFTIAHEFGHMVHQELSKKQGVLNTETPLTTAETASVFSEMLLFEHLKKNLKQEELVFVLASKLEDIFSTLFRQVVMTNFERRIHDIEEEVDAEELDKIWFEENERMFKDSVKLTKNYRSWWSYIPHFVHTPFYCYAYSYGQLLTLALYGLYKRSDSKKFIKTYTEFLSLGGSKSPRELVLMFDFDIDSKEFWEIGMQEVRNLLEEFERLLA
ncbi:M3 family oligoendopeptidase [Helicobacter cetorum]|uniref:M3 family oligoendopeptidase n=1 Tax=Helicobacter cetorum TaxID=138563 RepID=UPI000CF069D8|nr:M3 family oligoendopeptidase [Helicobacter cetorum]